MKAKLELNDCYHREQWLSPSNLSGELDDYYGRGVRHYASLVSALGCLGLQSSAITSQLHPSWKISYLQLRNSYIFVPLSLPCHCYQEMYIFKLENVLGHILAWSRFLVDLLGKYWKFDQESQFCDKTGSRVTM